MMKPPRPKVIKAKLEKELARYSSRIQKLASKAYQIRTMLEDITAMEANDALHLSGSEGQTGEQRTDSDAGQSNILDAAINPAVLDQQPAELRHDSPDIGLVEGSGV